MDIHISTHAAARLHALLAAETDGDQLAVRVVPLTSGCNTPSFALELTDILPEYIVTKAHGVSFTAPLSEVAWLTGIVINWDASRDKFSVFHPNPPHSSNCTLPNEGENLS
ncbi:Fe-S cluster assembly iron-binding protein IscA [Marininema mesophilum]|uniref:Fe-S cluster assembly iron-binding protein IscA n=1 Tax=Marininema mesophilum TaxID=1048340 RepID=A0A1H2Z558_9BACL|nr:hypothetical protein [Marininema mesophilum]SDX12562.1 Fe-S cluster assembly iron-binding protein IscA [Marininema mesophilum]